MEWTQPAIVLGTHCNGESGAVATVLTQDHGLVRGFAPGGASRGQTPMWQPGNILQIRLRARTLQQLGTLTGELVYPAAAAAFDDAWAIGMLSSICAIATATLPEHEPHKRLFDAMAALIVRLSDGPSALTDLICWEVLLLAELGYGLDLQSCALTGQTTDLNWVSPRTGRAVSETAAGAWKGRLLRLPGYLLGGEPDARMWAAGLALTRHFLVRNALGPQNLPLPLARARLERRVEKLFPPDASSLL